MTLTPYYQRDGMTIYHGDSREVMAALPPRSADIVLTDPPFSVPVKYHDAEGDFPRSWGDLAVLEPFFVETFKGMRRLVRDAGQVYVHCDGDTYPVLYKAAYSLWPQSHLIVWYKPSGRRGRGWLHSHELVLHLRTRHTEYPDGFRQDVIGVMPVRTLNRQHPAEKPGGLLSFLAEAMPDKPSVLCDPFMGSGPALWAAKEMGWSAIGIDVEEQWCEKAARRLDQTLLGIRHQPQEKPEIQGLFPHSGV